MDYEYRNKLYGGFAGKYIGVMHGAEIESWTYEKIKDVYGTITGYPVTFRNFCSDDDLNGPVFYMRALKDFACREDIPVAHMAHTLLNYAGERHGFFWWGGYGISTEETAYWNLRNHIPAPESGSALQNGQELAEQIGGQIFSDCWGLVCPGNPAMAARLAGKMSSVSHGGNGVYGGQFIAACIAAAFTASHIEEVIEAGLGEIPKDCEYAVMVRSVREQAIANENRFRDTFYYVQQTYGNDKYGGVCHIIPNGAIIVLSLIHGKGDFSRTLNICNMCGWDTDCNVGNAGTIMGVLTGADNIPEQWMTQVSDFLCASSVIGSLNIQTLSQAALIAAQIAHQLAGWETDTYDRFLFGKKEGKHFHFEFPTALHGLRVRGDEKSRILLKNTAEKAYGGERSLKITAPFLQKGEGFALYYQSYYQPGDFQDSRYDPDFSPAVYPGDRVSAMFLPGSGHLPLRLIPFIKERISGRSIRLEKEAVLIKEEDQWVKASFQIPFMADSIIEEAGWEIHCPASKCNEAFCIYMDDMEIESKPAYRINFMVLPLEKWNAVHSCVAHMTWLRGKMELENGCLAISGYGEPAECYTGDIVWDDYCMRTTLIPRKGDCHRVLFRVQGAMRCYGAGFGTNHTLCLWKKYGEYRILKETAFSWETDREYKLEIRAEGGFLTVRVDDILYLEAEDREQPYLQGAVGFGNADCTRTYFREYGIQSV